MEHEPEHDRALTEARLEVDRLQRELAVRTGHASRGELQFLVKRLELARKRLLRLLDGTKSGLLLLLLLLLLACVA
jgi:hypothetical protein